jgi:hypothetical protein
MMCGRLIDSSKKPIIYLLFILHHKEESPEVIQGSEERRKKKNGLGRKYDLLSGSIVVVLRERESRVENHSTKQKFSGRWWSRKRRRVVGGRKEEVRFLTILLLPSFRPVSSSPLPCNLIIIIIIYYTIGSLVIVYSIELL